MAAEMRTINLLRKVPRWKNNKNNVVLDRGHLIASDARENGRVSKQ
jgi:hypothetical protein